MDRLKFAMIDHVVRDIPQLFNLRTHVMTELGGIRSALGVVGYRAAQGQWPPTLPAVQPRFVPTLDTDPWFFEKEREVRDFYRYFVPIRDQPVAPRELPKPHTVRVDLSGSSAMGDVSGPGFLVSTLVNEQLKGLKEIAPEVIDPATKAVDNARLKEKWLEFAKAEARRIFSDQDQLKMLTDAMKMSSAASSDQALTGLKTLLEIPEAQKTVESEARRVGLTPDELKQYILKSNEAIFASEGFKAVVEAVKNNTPLTLEQLEGMQSAWIEAFSTTEMFDQSLKKIVVALANPASVATGPGLTAQLTEKDFILYSVGPDMKADYARIVGRSGPDILIWPPILTLERRALSGN
jgi:hypothetical protein